VSQNSMTHSLHSFALGISYKLLSSLFFYAQAHCPTSQVKQHQS
jgi:hypothetical protein